MPDIETIRTEDLEGQENTNEAAEKVADTKEEKAESKTYTEEELRAKVQSETDKRVTEAIKTAREKWDKEAAEEKKEAARLAKLSQEEREKELQAKQLKELEETKAELNRVYLERDTIDRLSEENVPIAFKDFLMGADAETTNDNIKAFKEVYEAEVQKGVEERLKGKTPSVANQKVKADVWSKLSEKYK